MEFNNQIPLLDQNFMQKLNEIRHRKVWAKIILLNWNEEPIEEITGHITTGSINVDGDSAVRRSCSFSMIPKENETFTDFYWTLNSKFKMYIGLNNTIEPNYPDIIWIPQGLFIITQFSKSETLNNLTLNIQARDKMCLLDGTVSGVVTANSVDFGTIDEPDPESGDIINKKLKMFDIVKEAVHEYAKEPYRNIIIEDLEKDILELLEYRGETPLYLFLNQDSTEIDNITLNDSTLCWIDENTSVKISDSSIKYDQRVSSLSTDLENNVPTTVYLTNELKTPYSIIKISYGETCGYRLTDLVYNGKLIANAGASIVNAVLEPIKKFGNFEYYYDIEGKFIFKEKDNYLYTSWTPFDGTYIENNMYDKDYSYSLTGNEVITAFNSTPNIKDLKNDFSIWGTKKSISGVDLPVHMRFAIDKKPIQYVSYDGVLYISDAIYSNEIDNNNFVQVQLTRGEKESYIALCKSIAVNMGIYDLENNEFLISGRQEEIEKKLQQEDQFYLYELIDDYIKLVPTNYSAGDWEFPFIKEDFPEEGNVYIKQSKLINVHCDWREIIYQMALDHQAHGQEEDFNIVIAKNNSDPLIGYPTGITGYEQYYTDILGFWRQLYNPLAEWTVDSNRQPENKILIGEEGIEPSIRNGDYGLKNAFVKFKDIDEFNSIIKSEEDLKEKLYFSSKELNLIQNLDKKYNNMFNLYCQSFLHESKGNLNSGQKIKTPGRLIVDLKEFVIQQEDLFKSLLNANNYINYNYQHEAYNQFEKWAIVRDDEGNIVSVDFSPFKLVISKSIAYDGKVEPLYEKYFMVNYSLENGLQWYEEYPKQNFLNGRKINVNNHTADDGYKLFASGSKITWDFDLFDKDLFDYIAYFTWTLNTDDYNQYQGKFEEYLDSQIKVENKLVKLEYQGEAIGYYYCKNGTYTTDFDLNDLLGNEINVSFFSGLVGCETFYLPKIFMGLNIDTTVKGLFLYGYAKAYDSLNLWDLCQSKYELINTGSILDNIYNNYLLDLYYKDTLNNTYNLINGINNNSIFILDNIKFNYNDTGFLQGQCKNILQINLKNLEIKDEFPINKIEITIQNDLLESDNEIFYLIKDNGTWVREDTKQYFTYNQSAEDFIIIIKFLDVENTVITNENYIEYAILNWDNIWFKGEKEYSIENEEIFNKFLKDFELTKEDFFITIKDNQGKEIFNQVKLENLLSLIPYENYYYLNLKWLNMNEIDNIDRYLISLIEENEIYNKNDYNLNFSDGKIYKLEADNLIFNGKENSSFIDPYWEIENINQFQNDKNNYKKGDFVIVDNNTYEKIDNQDIQLLNFVESVQPLYQEIRNKEEKSNDSASKTLNDLNTDGNTNLSVSPYKNSSYYRPGGVFSDSVFYTEKGDHFGIRQAIQSFCKTHNILNSWSDSQNKYLKDYRKYLVVYEVDKENYYICYNHIDYNDPVIEKNKNIESINSNRPNASDNWWDDQKLSRAVVIPLQLHFFFTESSNIITLKQKDNDTSYICVNNNVLENWQSSDLFVNVYKFKERDGTNSTRGAFDVFNPNSNESPWLSLGSITISAERGVSFNDSGAINDILDSAMVSSIGNNWNKILENGNSSWESFNDTGMERLKTQFTGGTSWLLDTETVGKKNIVFNRAYGSFYIMCELQNYNNGGNYGYRALRIPLYNKNHSYTKYFRRDSQVGTENQWSDGSTMALVKDKFRTPYNFCYTITENGDLYEINFYQCIKGNPLINIAPYETKEDIFEVKKYFLWNVLTKTTILNNDEQQFNFITNIRNNSNTFSYYENISENNVKSFLIPQDNEFSDVKNQIQAWDLVRKTNFNPDTFYQKNQKIILSNLTQTATALCNIKTSNPPAQDFKYWSGPYTIDDIQDSLEFLNDANKIIDFDEYGNPLLSWHTLNQKLQLGITDEKDVFQQRKIYPGKEYLYGWNRTISEDPANLNFWFDFLDTAGEMGKYSVYKIGDRPKTINENTLGGIYYKETPNIIYYTKDDLNNRQESLNQYTGYAKMFISQNEEEMFSQSGQKKSIKDRLDELLSQNAIVGESISITTLPIYNLTPNTLVKVQNDKIDGKYLASKYNIPLAHNGNTSLTMVRMDEGIL